MPQKKLISSASTKSLGDLGRMQNIKNDNLKLVKPEMNIFLTTELLNLASIKNAKIKFNPKSSSEKNTQEKPKDHINLHLETIKKIDEVLEKNKEEIDFEEVIGEEEHSLANMIERRKPHKKKLKVSNFEMDDFSENRFFEDNFRDFRDGFYSEIKSSTGNRNMDLTETANQFKSRENDKEIESKMISEFEEIKEKPAMGFAKVKVNRPRTKTPKKTKVSKKDKLSQLKAEEQKLRQEELLLKKEEKKLKEEEKEEKKFKRLKEKKKKAEVKKKLIDEKKKQKLEAKRELMKEKELEMQKKLEERQELKEVKIKEIELKEKTKLKEEKIKLEAKEEIKKQKEAEKQKALDQKTTKTKQKEKTTISLFKKKDKMVVEKPVMHNLELEQNTNGSILDEDIKKVLRITDDLLEKLPDEVIDEFANSKDFKLYEKVITKYKIK